MIILSVDSGVEKTGIAIFRKDSHIPQGFQYVYSDLIVTSKKEPIEKRLRVLHNKLLGIARKFKPNLLLLEQLFFFKNVKTAISVAQAQGSILLTAAKIGIPVKYLTPLQIKQSITGYGRADKKSVQKMLKILLKLDGQLKNDDVADAIACGLAYCYMNKKII
ncbi:crossover junction endodeoxyribonuclease RuvC [Candidatus Roizmanbacteria bacterium]|nr:crossover junction endodeoxyribonuclease RuvC [Candidatus Roizmanbacteria bacterium]